MKKYITAIIAIVIVAIILQSCTKKEDALVASTENQGYVVPQGSSDYDTTILNFYKKYGKYLLYKFTDKDTYWTPSGWKNATNATGNWVAGYLVTPSNPASVKKQLAIINKQWFGLYSDKFLIEFLPTKIMLCSTVDSAYPVFNFTTTPVTTTKGAKAVAAWYNYDNICVSNGGANGVDTMKTRDSINYLAKANRIFIQSIIGRNLNKANTDFTILTNYSLTTITSNAAAYSNGILPPYSGANANIDWGSYMLAMVTTSTANLTRSVVNTDATYNGILNVTKDANGIIKKRYDIVRNYFITNYNVDLQAIGNQADR